MVTDVDLGARRLSLTCPAHRAAQVSPSQPPSPSQCPAPETPDEARTGQRLVSITHSVPRSALKHCYMRTLILLIFHKPARWMLLSLLYRLRKPRHGADEHSWWVAARI